MRYIEMCYILTISKREKSLSQENMFHFKNRRVNYYESILL